MTDHLRERAADLMVGQGWRQARVPALAATMNVDTETLLDALMGGKRFTLSPCAGTWWLLDTARRSVEANDARKTAAA